jgi:hypothetical protein
MPEMNECGYGAFPHSPFSSRHCTDYTQDGKWKSNIVTSRIKLIQGLIDSQQ